MKNTILLLFEKFISHYYTMFAGDSGSEIPNNLPKKQRELFLRIQAQQKENIPENQHANDDTSTLKDDDWYSSDDDNDPLSKMVIHLVS